MAENKRVQRRQMNVCEVLVLVFCLATIISLGCFIWAQITQRPFSTNIISIAVVTSASFVAGVMVLCLLTGLLRNSMVRLLGFARRSKRQLDD